MNMIFAVETNSTKKVADTLEDLRARSMIWMKLIHSGKREQVLVAAEAVLDLIQDRVTQSGPPMEGCVVMSYVADRLGNKWYQEFGLVFSDGRSCHEPFDAIDDLNADALYRTWTADIGIEKTCTYYNIDTYLDALRKMHFESAHGPRKLYRQAKTIEIFPFTGTTVELGILGEVAAMFGASPLIAGLKPISAI